MTSEPPNIAPPTAVATDRRLWLAIVLLVGLTLCWPGDTQWINDEPILLYKAWHANADGRLAPEGINHPGSTGIYYHPVTTWFYQPLLLLSHDLVVVAWLKTLVCTVAMVLGLLALAREAGTSRWPALLALAAPWLFIANRHLWDNVQMVPLVPWFIWCLARAQRTQRVWPIVVGLVLAVWLFHIHVVAAVVIAAWGLTLLLYGWRWLLHRWLSVGLAGLAALLAIYPYVVSFMGHIYFQREMQEATHLAGLWNGWRGALYFTGQGLDAAFPELGTAAGTVPAWLWQALVGLSVLGLPLGLWGLIDWAGRLKREWPTGTVSLRAQLGTAALLTILLTVALYVYTRQTAHKHYFHASWWASWWFVAWGAEDAWRRWRAGRLAVLVHAAALVGLVIGLALHLHLNGGNRTPAFGATLTNQLAVARQVIRYQPTELVIGVENYALFKHSYELLYSLLLTGQPEATTPAVVALVYRDGPDAKTGWIKAVITPAAPPAP